MAHRAYALHRPTVGTVGNLPEQETSPQSAAWKGLYKEYGATMMRRHAKANGDIRLTLWRADQRDPVCKATITKTGHVVTDLMDEVIA
jgi:hypothetical protein